MKLDTINISTIWTMLAGTVAAVVYMFSNFASAGDLERIEILMIKSDIREVRQLIREYPEDERLADELEELIDELCTIKPEDRECHE